MRTLYRRDRDLWTERAEQAAVEDVTLTGTAAAAAAATAAPRGGTG